MKKIDVLKKGSLFTVFKDLNSGAYLPISSVEYVAPLDAMPVTFNSEDSLRIAFNNYSINIIGNESANDERLARTVSDTELSLYLNKEEREDFLLKKETKKEIGLDTNFVGGLGNSTSFEFLKLFSSQTYRLTDKRNKGGKDYLNGMAKVILTVCPELKEDLKACLFAKNIKEKDDLL